MTHLEHFLSFIHLTRLVAVEQLYLKQLISSLKVKLLLMATHKVKMPSLIKILLLVVQEDSSNTQKTLALTNKTILLKKLSLSTVEMDMATVTEELMESLVQVAEQSLIYITI